LNHPVCLLHQVFIQALHSLLRKFQKKEFYVDLSHAHSGSSPRTTSNEAHHRFLKPKKYQYLFCNSGALLIGRLTYRTGEPRSKARPNHKLGTPRRPAMASPISQTCTGAQQRDIRLACVLDRPADLLQVQRDIRRACVGQATRHTASVRCFCREKPSTDDTSPGRNSHRIVGGFCAS